MQVPRTNILFSTAASMCVLLTWGAAAQGTFDGVYRGTVTTTRGTPPACRADGPFTLKVESGKLEVAYRIRNPIILRAEVGRDGGFEARTDYSAGPRPLAARLTGRIANGELKAEMWGDACTYALSLQRAKG